MIWEHAPWFSVGEGDDEPIAYRVWKRLWQVRGRRGWKSDLFDKISKTEWDLLIVLDACRFDTLAGVADCAVIEQAVSPATTTGMFLRYARGEGVFDGMTYVSGNPQSGKHSPGEVDHIPIYDTEWSNELSTVPPEPVYEKARERLENGDRVVAHTIQPHYPHICEIGNKVRPVVNGLHPKEMDTIGKSEFQVQSVLARGMVDLNKCRRSYQAAVRFAWERAQDLAVSLTDNDYTVVITADHGELFGERGFVEHPTSIKIRQLIEVPWIVFRPGKEGQSAKDRLAALGYVDR